ncbi:MAG: hypothetical protein AAGB31_01200 [Bdellovibrio sp.]
MRTLRNIILLLMFVYLSACGQITGEGLLSDAKEDTDDYYVDLTPSSAELYMAVSSSVIYNATTKAEMTGECYISTYPSHYIQAYLASTSGSVLAVLDVHNNTSGTTAQCKNGRFDIIVNTSGVSAGQRIWLVLTATESGGSSYTAETSFLIYK